MVWQYRPALDGLRTVAVYLVLCFHAKLGWADGGFVGVDLFFVLSGFLVASLLLEERYTTGRIALGSFFARRMRRLLPAALVVVVATALVFLLVAPVTRRLDWVGDAQASLLYVANWRFLISADEYFAADVTTSPYLHFWSLSVEEQFYVAFPFVLLGLVALKRWWRPAVVVGVATILAASLAAQLWRAQDDVLHAYYGTDARLYQPMAGVLAAIAWRHLATRTRALRSAGWPMFIGLLVVGSSLLDVSQSTRGMLATVFSVGLVLTVMTRTTPSLDRFLAAAPLAYLGRISYGTYLWHWPVLLLVTSAVEAPAWADALLTAAIATGLAALSFELLEQPIRTSARLAVSASPTILVGLTCSVLAAYAVVPRVLENDVRPALVAGATASPGASGTAMPRVSPTRTPDTRRAEVPAPGDPVPEIDWRAIHDSRGAETAYCTLTDTTSCVGHVGTSDLRVMLVGDSHARVLAPTLLAIARQRNFTLTYSMVPGCPWQEGVVATSSSDDVVEQCREARAAFYGGLPKKMKIDVVILTEMPRSSDAWDQLVSTTGSTQGIDELNLTTMTSSLRKIRQAGAKALVMDAWIQQYDGVGPLDCLAAAKTVGQCTVEARPAPLTDAIVRTLAIGSGGAIRRVGINDIVCPTYPACMPVLDGIPVWRDMQHYSTEVLLDHVTEIRDRLLGTGLLR
ncbi:acyltransferase family protein [Nocardioides sp.]|uniref:acyltransferase family protein n=1 Tax=Nocardioides sp. TaxID=35761 RepID=UPI002B968836|nr:acyltransferase family protein [Nocardioides sp.]HSX69267.1 acyltransferase family protein [Nocardioides sp.]